MSKVGVMEVGAGDRLVDGWDGCGAVDGMELGSNRGGRRRRFQ